MFAVRILNMLLPLGAIWERRMRPQGFEQFASDAFFLQDLENTAGSWDLYGQTDERRYPGIQAEFFERAAAPLTRRESVYAFVTAGVTLLRVLA